MKIGQFPFHPIPMEMPSTDNEKKTLSTMRSSCSSNSDAFSAPLLYVSGTIQTVPGSRVSLGFRVVLCDGRREREGGHRSISKSVCADCMLNGMGSCLVLPFLCLRLLSWSLSLDVLVLDFVLTERVKRVQLRINKASGQRTKGR